MGDIFFSFSVFFGSLARRFPSQLRTKMRARSCRHPPRHFARHGRSRHAARGVSLLVARRVERAAVNEGAGLVFEDGVDPERNDAEGKPRPTRSSDFIPILTAPRFAQIRPLRMVGNTGITLRLNAEGCDAFGSLVHLRRVALPGLGSPAGGRPRLAKGLRGSGGGVDSRFW